MRLGLRLKDSDLLKVADGCINVKRYCKMKDFNFEEFNKQLRAKAEEEGYSVQDRPNPSGEQLISEHDIFDLARHFAKGVTQREIAELLEKNVGKKVTIMAVSKMLSGERKMLNLAMEWVLTCYPANVEWEGEKQPTRYFKLKEH